MTVEADSELLKIPAIGEETKPRLLGPQGRAELAAPLEGPPRPGRALHPLKLLQSRGAPQPM